MPGRVQEALGRAHGQRCSPHVGGPFLCSASLWGVTPRTEVWTGLERDTQMLRAWRGGPQSRTSTPHCPSTFLPRPGAVQATPRV